MNNSSISEYFNDDFTGVKGSKSFDQFMKSSSLLSSEEKIISFEVETWDKEINEVNDSVKLFKQDDTLLICYDYKAYADNELSPHYFYSNNNIIIRCKKEEEIDFTCMGDKLILATNHGGQFSKKKITIKIPETFLKGRNSIIFEPNLNDVYCWNVSELESVAKEYNIDNLVKDKMDTNKTDELQVTGVVVDDNSNQLSVNITLVTMNGEIIIQRNNVKKLDFYVGTDKACKLLVSKKGYVSKLIMIETKKSSTTNVYEIPIEITLSKGKNIMDEPKPAGIIFYDKETDYYKSKPYPN